MNPIGNLTMNQSLFNPINNVQFSTYIWLINVVHLSLATTILFVGAWSNVIVTVILTGCKFASVHYIPYKVLAVLEALLCLNQVITNITVLLMSEDSYLSVYYTAFISRFILSGVTYSAIYLTLLMTADRYIAVCYPQFYHCHVASVTTRKVGALVIFLIALGYVLNSWSAFATHKIVTLQFVDGNGYNYTRLFLDKDHKHDGEIIVKDYYNMTIKVSVVFAQLAMAAQILVRLYQQRRKFQFMSSATSSGNTRVSQAATGQRSTARHEQSVIKFLLIVSFLGLLRELFSEGHRIAKLSLANKIDEWGHEHDVQVLILRLLYVIGTTITAMDRSFKLYLYLAISGQFRDGLRDKLPQWCCFRHTAVSV